MATPFFSLKIRANHSEKNRIGVVASVAVNKSAVKRNFWRRQTKATLMGAPAAGLDILVILSPRVEALSKKQFKKTLLDSVARFSNSST